MLPIVWEREDHGHSFTHPYPTIIIRERPLQALSARSSSVIVEKPTAPVSNDRPSQQECHETAGGSHHMSSMKNAYPSPRHCPVRARGGGRISPTTPAVDLLGSSCLASISRLPRSSSLPRGRSKKFMNDSLPRSSLGETKELKTTNQCCQ